MIPAIFIGLEISALDDARGSNKSALPTVALAAAILYVVLRKKKPVQEEG